MRREYSTWKSNSKTLFGKRATTSTKINYSRNYDSEKISQSLWSVIYGSSYWRTSINLSQEVNSLRLDYYCKRIFGAGVNSMRWFFLLYLLVRVQATTIVVNRDSWLELSSMSGQKNNTPQPDFITLMSDGEFESITGIQKQRKG